MIKLWKRKPNAAMQASAGAAFSRLPSASLKSTVADDVRRAAYPGHDAGFLHALVGRALAETDAAAALPITPEASAADACLVEQLEALRAEVSRSRDRRAAARLAREEAERRFHELPRPLGALALGALHLVAIAATGVAVVATAALMAPSADALLLRPYVTSTFESDDGRFSATLAFWCAMTWAGALLGCQLAAVILSRGALHWIAKALFLLLDAAFAGAFALMRLGDEFSWQAASVSIFELAIAGAGTLMLLAVASVLRRNAERSEPFKLARQELAFAKDLDERAADALDAAEARVHAQAESIGAREDALRREARLRDLARASVIAEYQVEVSRLIAEAARNASSDALMERLEREINEAFAREGVRKKS